MRFVSEITTILTGLLIAGCLWALIPAGEPKDRYRSSLDHDPGVGDLGEAEPDLPPPSNPEPFNPAPTPPPTDGDKHHSATASPFSDPPVLEF